MEDRKLLVLTQECPAVSHDRHLKHCYQVASVCHGRAFSTTVSASPVLPTSLADRILCADKDITPLAAGETNKRASKKIELELKQPLSR